MNRSRVLLSFLFVAVLAISEASAQKPCSNGEAPPIVPCAPGIPLNGGNPPYFSAVPFTDGSGTTQYGDPDHNIVSLYGAYGNTEPSTHFTQGTDLAGQIVPLCFDGTTNCSSPAIVFLFIGFSNCSIEVCGGNSDIWDNQDQHQQHLEGQPCATLCENFHNPDLLPAWNQVQGDSVLQQSFLYQVYHPTPHLVGDHVVVFNGAFGAQTLDRWDPTAFGYYAQHNDCTFDHSSSLNPECNYIRVRDDLSRNGYSEKQVQAIFLKSSTAFPQCDLKLQHCVQSSPASIPDAYVSEQYLGNILRYLKCCKRDPYGQPIGSRYPNLKQVFLSSRIYGGYANGTDHGCTNPEPYAYESGFAVQRSIVAQIDRTSTDYVGMSDTRRLRPGSIGDRICGQTARTSAVTG